MGGCFIAGRSRAGYRYNIHSPLFFSFFEVSQLNLFGVAAVGGFVLFGGFLSRGGGRVDCCEAQVSLELGDLREICDLC